jgi:hypothetical protein
MSLHVIVTKAIFHVMCGMISGVQAVPQVSGAGA